MIQDIKAMLAKRKARRAKRKAKGLILWGKDGQQTITSIKLRLWNLVSEFVKLRDRHFFGKCVVGVACSGRGAIEVAYHIMPSSYGSATRYDLDNIVGACTRCNNGERMNRMLYQERHHPRIFGAERIAALKARARETRKYMRSDLLDMILKVRRLLESGAYRSKGVVI